MVFVWYCLHNQHWIEQLKCAVDAAKSSQLNGKHALLVRPVLFHSISLIFTSTASGCKTHTHIHRKQHKHNSSRR